MIDVLVIGERASADVINTIMDKSTHIAVRDCIIEGPGYLSNINSYVGISGCRFEDTTIVLRDSKENKIETCIIDHGVIKGVSIVQGYAYTHQVILTSQNGLSTQPSNFTIND